MYAIVEKGGKQYKVMPGRSVDIDLTHAADGDKVELDKVLLIADGDRVTVGSPAIEGAKVLATAQSMVKGKKIIVLRFKHKNRYTRKTGHRQKYTRLTVDSIVGPSAEQANEQTTGRQPGNQNERGESSGS